MVYTTMPPAAYTRSNDSLTPLNYAPYGSDTYLARITSSNSVSQPNTLLTKGIHRSRFCLRLLSTTFAGALIGSLSLALHAYNDTKEEFFLWEGRQIWPAAPAKLDLAPSDLFLILAATFLATSSALVLGSIWPKIRHLTTLGNTLTFVVAFLNFVLSLTAVVYLYAYTPSAGNTTFWKWTCDNRRIDHPDIQFSLVCTEIRFAWAMGIAVVGTEVLSIANFVAAVVLLRQRRKLERSGSFFEKN